jgi:acetolactate synthase-1/2/3 large subunit
VTDAIREKPSPPGQTVADALVQALELLDVRLAFGLPGVHNLALWSALGQSPIRLIGVRHEQTTAYAADGLARVTGGLGVALTTTGPGAANAVAATGEAWASGSPVLVIATDIPAALRRPGEYRGVLHESIDQAAMFAPVVKAAIPLSDPAGACEAVVRAGELALEAPAAPVYVEIPTDLMSAATAEQPPDRQAPAYPEPIDEQVSSAAALLAGAQRPLIWAGRGALGSTGGGAQWIDSLARRLGAPVIETFGARGVIPPSHPCWVGLTPHLPEVGELWDSADVVVAIGTNFSGTITQNWAMPAPPHLITINILAESRGYAPEIALVGEATAVTRRLCEQLGPEQDCTSVERSLQALHRRVDERLHREDSQALAIIDDLAAAVPADVPVAVDMCIAGYWVGATRTFSQPARLAYPIGWGTLGFAFPASIGMAMALDQPTLCVCGDGGFLYACGELSTLAEQRPPLTVLVVDDGGYGMLRYDQEHSGRQTTGVDFPTADFVALAQAFEIPAQRVSGVGAPLQHALAEALDAGEPRVLVLEAVLRPPESTSPRWYRKHAPAGAAVSADGR